MDTTHAEVMVAALAADVPQLYWGAPGIGKTSSIIQTCEQMGYHVRVLTGNVRLPEDFGGMPVVRGDRVIMSPPDWAVEANEHPKAVIVFDELTTSTPAVQSAMLRILTERYAGDYLLGDGVRFIACANPPGQAANGWELPPPLANRFLHLDFRASVDEWVDGMTIGWDRMRAPEVPTVKHRDWAPVIAGYIQARRDHLDPAPPKDAHLAGRAWPSPRTWDYAAKVLSYCHTAAAEHLALAGLVGNGPAAECMAWLREADLPSPQSLLNDPASFNWNDGKRADRAFAALASVVSYVGSDIDEHWAAGWKLLGHVGGTTRVDVGINAADLMLRLDDTNKRDIPFEDLLPFADLIRKARGR